MLDFLKNLYALKPMLEELFTPLLVTSPDLEPPGPFIIYVNSAFCKLSGYERDEIIGKNPKILQGLKTDRVFVENLKKSLQKGEYFEGNTINYKKDGSEYRTHLSISPIYNEKRSLVCYLSVQQDLSHIDAIQERFDLAIEATNDGLWDWNPQNNRVFFSRRWKEMLGFEDEEIGDTLDEWSLRVHPDDLEKAFKDVKLHLDGKSEFYINEHRMLCKDGSYKWILDRGKALFDSNNKPYRMIGFHSDLTGQSKLKEALYARNRVLQKLSEQVPGVIYQYQYYLDGRSRFPFASAHICDIYEVSPEEVNQDASIVLERIYSEDYDKVIDSIKDSFEHLRLWECEYRVLLPKKGLRWLLGVANPEKQSDGSVIWYGYIYDITSKKELEESLELQKRRIQEVVLEQNRTLEEQIQKRTQALKNQYRKYQTLFDTGSDAFFVFGFDENSNPTNFMEINKQAIEITKYNQYELLSMTPMDLFAKESKYFVEKRDRLKEYGPEEDEIVSKDGESIQIEMNCKTFNQDGKPLCFAAIRDIRKRKELEKKQKAQEHLMIQQSKMAALGEMIGAIAHQWKQPLNAISALVGTLDDVMENNNKEEFEELEQNIYLQIEFMSQTINDFRNFLKTDKKRQQFQISSQIKNIIHLMKSIFIKNNINVVFHEHKDLSVIGYPNEFQQVILNLLSNSKDALISSGITNKQIDIYVEKIDNSAVIKIRDNGAGIKEDLLPNRLFEAHISTKGDQGNGIGLSLSKTIIEESMNGRLWAQNLEGGAEFIIELENI